VDKHRPPPERARGQGEARVGLRSEVAGLQEELGGSGAPRAAGARQTPVLR